METQQKLIAPNLSQDDYKKEILRMHSRNYNRFRKEEFRLFLFKYFLFLENKITWTKNSKFKDSDFTIEELENIINEMVAVSRKIDGTKLVVNQILNMASVN